MSGRNPNPLHFLAGGGAMGALLGAMNRAQIAIGPTESWPQSLRTAVSIMLGAPYPAFIAWGPRLSFLYNDAYRAVLGARHPGALGCSYAETHAAEWAEIEPALRRALAGEAAAADDVALTPIRDESGGIGGFFGFVRESADEKPSRRATMETAYHLQSQLDVTRLRRESADREAALQAEVEFALDAGGLGAWKIDLRGGGLIASRLFKAAFGVIEKEDLSQGRMTDMVHPEDRERLRAALDQAIARRTDFEAEYRIVRTDGQTRWLLSRGRATYDAAGQALHMAGIALDISDRRETERRQHVLLMEMNHRAKNLLAVVQTIAQQTAVETDPGTFAAQFSGRIVGLAATQELIVRNDWRGVVLTELIQAQLAPFGQDILACVEMEGPPLFVATSGVQTLGMALHELAAHAVAQGRFKEKAGRVRIAWSLPLGKAGSFALEWREPRAAGGSAIAGYGLIVVTRMVEHAFDAQAELGYISSGVVWRMSAAANNLLQRMAL